MPANLRRRMRISALWLPFARDLLIQAFLLYWSAVALDAAITYPAPPPGGREHVLAALKDTPPNFAEFPPVERLTIAQPYRWYSVGADDVASGRLLAKARSASWLYPLMEGNKGSGNVQLNASAKIELAVEGVHQTNFSQESLNAVQTAQQLPQVKKADYELRRLDIAALSVVIIWLHGQSDDILIPLPPTYGRFEPYRTYTEKQLIDILKPDAQSMLKMWGKLNNR
jgi:hypothetical protein